MALTVYPTPGFNSYISVAEADLIAPDYLNYSFWSSLDEATKSQYLMQAFRVIGVLEGFIAPIPPADAGCLPTVQVQIAMNDVQYGISLKTYDTQEIKKEVAGPVSTEYFASYSGALPPSIIPPIVVPCLKTFGYSPSLHVYGISTIRHHR